jgi:hypothetical protein
MTARQWLLGCSVIAAVLIAGTISWGMVNRQIPDAKSPTASSPEIDDSDEAGGICFTIDGKRFSWHFANVPFGALRCSN